MKRSPKWQGKRVFRDALFEDDELRHALKASIKHVLNMDLSPDEKMAISSKVKEETKNEPTV